MNSQAGDRNEFWIVLTLGFCMILSAFRWLLKVSMQFPRRPLPIKELDAFMVESQSDFGWWVCEW